MHTAYEFIFSHITFILYIMLFLFMGSAAIEVYQYNNFNHTVGEVVSRYGGLTEPAAKNIKNEEHLRYGNLFTVKTAKKNSEGKWQPDKDFTDEPVGYGKRINYFIIPNIPFMVNHHIGVPIHNHVQSDVRAEDVANTGTEPKYPLSDIKVYPVVTHARVSNEPSKSDPKYDKLNELYKNSFSDFNALLMTKIKITDNGKIKDLADANPGAKARLLPTKQNQDLLSNGNFYGETSEKAFESSPESQIQVEITWSNGAKTDVNVPIVVYGANAVKTPSSTRMDRHDDIDSSAAVKAAHDAISDHQLLDSKYTADYAWVDATTEGAAGSKHTGTVKVTYPDGTYQIVKNVPYELSNKELG